MTFFQHKITSRVKNDEPLFRIRGVLYANPDYSLDKLYNLVAIIRAVNADSVFPLPLLPFFPLLLDLLALRTPLQELNNYSHGCYSEHNLPRSHIGFYCFSTYSAEKISCVRVNSFHLSLVFYRCIAL